MRCRARRSARINYVGLGARVGLEFYTEDRLSTAAKDLVSRTTILFDAVEGPAGEYPVVLGPGSSGILLHEAIGHGMEADAARSKRTIYADQIGQRIAPKNVTIVDDGTNANLRGSINTDDEGEDSQRTVLVENGILRTFMHDRISAQHFGVEPTGNGRRQSFRHIPLPRMRNTYMLGGHTPRDEIVASVEFGIYADHFTNGQVNIGQGDFTFYIKNGWLIEGGKLTRPIKDVNIIGNGPDVLRGVTMVGDDFELDTGTWVCGKRGQSVPVGLGMPTVKVGALTVGGRECVNQEIEETGAVQDYCEEMRSLAAQVCELATRAGAQNATASAGMSRSRKVVVRDGLIEEVKASTSRGISIRVCVDGRYGAHSTADLTSTSLERFVSRAVAMTRVLMPDEHRALPDPSLYAGRKSDDLGVYDRNHTAWTADARMTRARAAHDAAKSAVGDHGLSVMGAASDGVSWSALVNTNGFSDVERFTSAGVSAMVNVLDPSGKRPSDWFDDSTRMNPETLDVMTVGRTAAERALAQIGAVEAKSMSVPLIVENRAIGRLLGGLLSPLGAMPWTRSGVVLLRR